MSVELISKMRRWLPGIALGALLAAEVQAAPVRVATWNLQGGFDAAKGATPEKDIHDAAEALSKLNPEIIILQRAPDWKTCDELAKALKSGNYNVAVCSSFRDARTGQLTKQQVAILSRTKAYISWAEAWKATGGAVAAPGGFAFAAIRLENKNVGIYSIQLGDETSGVTGAVQQSAREVAVMELLQQTASVQKWAANAVQSVVIAGDFIPGEKTAGLLDEAGMANAFLNLPPEKRITIADKKQSGAETDAIFIRDAGLAANPQIVSTTASPHYPVTCDLDFDGPTPVAAELPAQDISTAAQKLNPWAMAGLALGGVLLMAILWRLARRRPEPVPAALLSAGARSGSGLISGTERIKITQSSGTASGGSLNGPPESAPVVHIEVPAYTQTEQSWQRRAEEAERRADQARTALREGLIPHLSRWLKNRLTQRLVSDRAHLMQAQQAAAYKALSVDERLTKVEWEVRERMRAYEERIEELMKELAVAKEENRELIRAKIAEVRAEMERERLKARQNGKQ